MTTRRVALLRGVNVGGNRRLPMADLKAFVESLGYGNVRTLLASGNVVFDGAVGTNRDIEQQLESTAAHRIGLSTEFFVRDADDLARVVADNPFAEQALARPNRLLVHFHRDPVPLALVEAMTMAMAGPERMFAAGRELYIDYADGIGTSTLPQGMAKARVPTSNTARNWNTVTKLRAMFGDG